MIPQTDAVMIAGQRFVAGTMWFRADATADQSKRLMRDFSLIQDFEPWVYEQNAVFEQVKALDSRTLSRPVRLLTRNDPRGGEPTRYPSEPRSLEAFDPAFQIEV